ncbi:MAG: hypothetical protein DI628_00920 [Blastochloris viridis]|uniref:Uncharacterized protein n=1 Tax=Blastochloris viridis TaxID=1079 RepID=A0A6N4R7A9_BLAVI|nr:MAG: hypothetical protein DI628_00920 [Blastochloris viridis]
MTAYLDKTPARARFNLDNSMEAIRAACPPHQSLSAFMASKLEVDEQHLSLSTGVTNILELNDIAVSHLEKQVATCNLGSHITQRLTAHAMAAA